MSIFYKLKIIAVCAFGLVALARLGAADPLPPLTLKLAIIASAGQPQEMELSRDQLLALPKRIVKTMTPWTHGLVEFEGVALAELIRISGATPTRIQATALNNYAVELPAADAGIADVIVAYRMNGEYMPVRDKGPLWLIYPLTGKPELDTEETHSKMIWQLQSLELR
jgi:hypothetical protein